MADLSKLSDDEILGMLGQSQQAKVQPVASWSDEAILKALGEKPKDQGMAGSLIDSFTQGATFNFGDEMTALEAGVLGRTPEGGWFDYSKPFGQRYDDALAAERAQNEKFQEEHPAISTAAEITGAIAGPGKIAAGTNAVRGLAGTMAAGATGGAVAGYGAGEGGVTDRLQNAAYGGMVGGAAGGVLYPVAKGVGKAAGYVGRKISEKTGQQGAKSAAERQVMQAMTDDGMTPQRVAARLKMMGPQATIADAAGKNVRGVARAASGVPGKAKNTAERVFEGRNASQFKRVEKAAEEGLNETGEGFYDQIDDLMTMRSRAADPLYKKAVNPQNLIPDDEFAKLAKDEFIADTLASVQKDKLYGMGAMQPNSMPVLDAAKKRLDDMIGAARRAGENNKVRLLTDKKNQIVELADKHFPDYKLARDAFSGPSQSLDAMEAGRNFMKGDLEMTIKQLAKLPENDKTFFRAGVMRELRKIIRNTPDNSDVARKIMRDPGKRDALKAVFPDQKSFREFEKQMIAEMKMAGTRNFVLSGSQTAPRIAEESALNGAVDMATGGKATIIDRGLRAAADWVNKPPKSTSEQLAEILMNPNAAQNASRLSQFEQQALADALRQAQIGRAGRAVLTGGVAGTQ